MSKKAYVRDLSVYSHSTGKKKSEKKNAPNRDIVGKKHPITNELDFRCAEPSTVRKLSSELRKCLVEGCASEK